MLALFTSQGISFDEIFICPHMADEGCECRKPRAGLLTS
jgi:imidazoleglycerol-phosphate dehydratase/histidinol-phosphatase